MGPRHDGGERHLSLVPVSSACQVLFKSGATTVCLALHSDNPGITFLLLHCRPDSIWELDLSLQLFQFFFTGMKNQSRFFPEHIKDLSTFFLRIYLPDKGDIFSSGMRRNFSKITNDISFISSKDRKSQKSRSTASSHLVVVFTVFLGTLLAIF